MNGAVRKTMWMPIKTRIHSLFQKICKTEYIYLPLFKQEKKA